MDACSFNILSLCSGVGGLDLGVRLAVENARTVCYVEREAFCCEVLASRMEEACLDQSPIWSDLRTFDGKPWRKVVDCVIGGYPCQPFSVAGKKLGDKDDRHLWPDIARILREVEPAWCFFENVPGHLRLGFREVYDELFAMGYRTEAGLFTAAEIGCTQERERLFFLAHKESNWWEVHPISREERTGEVDIGRNVNWRHATGVVRDAIENVDYGNEQRSKSIQQGKRATASQKRNRESASGSGENVGRLHGKGLQGRSLRDSGWAGRPNSPFPPGPADAEGWEQILDYDPSLAPATLPEVHGVVDGLAPRVDRLRACGNGVVPDVAAFAWRYLMRKFQ